VVSLAVVFAPHRAAAAARALGHPWRSAFPPPPPAIVLSPGPSEVKRGVSLDLELSAPGRRWVELLWRARGELPGRRRVDLDPLSGEGHGTIGPILEPAVYWAEDASRTTSDTFSVRPVDPLLLTALTVRVRFPSYRGRPDEEYTRPVPTLVVPAGSTIEIAGRANYPLARAELRGRNLIRILEVRGSAFSGTLRPTRSGVWGWRFASMLRGEAGILTDSLEIVVRRDLLPSVDIVSPGSDMDVGEALRLPLVIDARDDEEIRDVEIVSWRASATHQWYPARRERIGGAPNSGPRLVLTSSLDLSGRGLLPGDTLVYVARARDVNPRHRWVVSDTFRVWLPSLIELRERASERAQKLRREAEGIRESAAELTRAAHDARLRAPVEAESPSSAAVRDQTAGSRSSFGSTADGRQVLQRAQQMRDRLEGLRQSLTDLKEDLDRAGLGDPRLREQLQRLQALTRELLESGLKERIEELERALQNLDEEQMRAALGALSQKMAALRDQLEQSVALLERVALEQAVRSARERAADLAGRQERLASDVRPEPAWSGSEQRLAARADSLSTSLRELAKRLKASAAAESDSTASAGHGASRAAAEMRAAAAAQQSARGAEAAEFRPDGTQPAGSQVAGSQVAGSQAGGSQAGARSARAATEMRSAADALESVERRLTRDWKQDALDAVERSLEETLTLAREQSAISSELAARPSLSLALRGRQAAVRQGLDNVMQSLAEASRRTALLNRRTGPTAARAAEEMDRVLLSLAPGLAGGPPPDAPGMRKAAESLNELAAELLATRNSVRSAGSATGMQEALEQMARMARAQGGINREGGGLLPLTLAGQRVDERLRALAREQAAVAKGLRDLGEQAGATQLTGRPEEMAAEAEAIADRLAQGRLDRETLARQERLFRTLLDAGRSLERGEDPKRRESETGHARRGRAIPALSPEVASGPRFPLPKEGDLLGFSAAYRRMVFDYFARLNRGGPVDGAVDTRDR